MSNSMAKMLISHNDVEVHSLTSHSLHVAQFQLY